MLTPQQVFDIAVGGVLSQGWLCQEPNGQCVYTRGTSHCAVGWLVPDNDWDEMGTFSISALGRGSEYAPANRA